MEAIKVVRCQCGEEMRGPEAELIPAVQRHGRDVHNMEATPEQILAIAVPVTPGPRAAPAP